MQCTNKNQTKKLSFFHGSSIRRYYRFDPVLNEQKHRLRLNNKSILYKVIICV